MIDLLAYLPDYPDVGVLNILCCPSGSLEFIAYYTYGLCFLANVPDFLGLIHHGVSGSLSTITSAFQRLTWSVRPQICRVYALVLRVSFFFYWGWHSTSAT